MWTKMEIDWYGFLAADTNISAIHGPITDISKIFNLVFCFIIKNVIYFMPFLSFKNLKNKDL